MKSYVTMFTCPICKKENGTIGLDKRLKESFEMYTPSSEPCDKCRKKYLKTGILIINPENGDLVVLKTTALKRIFDKIGRASCRERV